MKNSLRFLFIFLIISQCFLNKSFSEDTFSFNVKEIEIKENGNKFFGKKGGTVNSNDGVSIKADNFYYDKIKNIIIASDNVKFNNTEAKIIIYSNKVTYFKRISIY